MASRAVTAARRAARALARAGLLALALCAVAAEPPALEAALLAEAYAPESVAFITAQRRALHAIPELAFEEAQTSAAIRAALDGLGVEYDHPVARTGARAARVGRKGGSARSRWRAAAPCTQHPPPLRTPTPPGVVARVGPPPYRVALRADIDALPIPEGLDLPWASRHAGRMHACGHDGHAAMLLGAARLLAARGDTLAALGGGVLLVFQPAEEGRGGALEVVRSGALHGVAAMFGQHVWPSPDPADSGRIMTRPGAMMGASTVRSAGAGGGAVGAECGGSRRAASPPPCHTPLAAALPCGQLVRRACAEPPSPLYPTHAPPHTHTNHSASL